MTKSRAKVDITITLVAHACLRITYQDFTILTDPWLFGPAFLGSWIGYPAFPVKVEALEPDVIWITHEHSDHFHRQSLERFERTVPIYFPAFPNQRIERYLESWGFVNLHPLKFGEKSLLNEDIAITVYEPQSLWNDSIALIELEGFKILNINDAGVNHRISKLVKPVDLVAAQFSPGASGFPITWMDRDPKFIADYYENARNGMREMLHHAALIYDATYILPFASHFVAWHPSHRHFNRMVKRVPVDEIKESFKDAGTEVINLLPGESWNSYSGTFERVWRDREKLYKDDAITKYVERKFSEDEFNQYHPVVKTVTDEQIKSYFLPLNRVPEIAFCEDINFEVSLLNTRRDRTFRFSIDHGRISNVSANHDCPIHISIYIPEPVLAHIVENDASWDEAHIGFWCRFRRDPDIYHADFWRLLQAPYYKKENCHTSVDALTKTISLDTCVQKILDCYGDRADRILRRYGLYCGGCGRAQAESLDTALRFHGLSDESAERLVRELNEVSK